MLLNCSVGEDSWESLDCKNIQPVHPKGIHSWVFIGRTDAEAETPVLWLPDGKNWLIWNDPDAGKDSRWGEKGTTGGWDGWMASLTRWTWVWIISGSWWWTGRPGVLQSMGLQRVGDDGVTGLNWVCYITSAIDSTDVSFVFHPNRVFHSAFSPNIPSFSPQPTFTMEGSMYVHCVFKTQCNVAFHLHLWIETIHMLRL